MSGKFTRMSGRSLSSVLGPMPRTRSKSSITLYGPFFARSSRIRCASAGPIPGNNCNSVRPAALMSIVPVNAGFGARSCRSDSALAPSSTLAAVACDSPPPLPSGRSEEGSISRVARTCRDAAPAPPSTRSSRAGIGRNQMLQISPVVPMSPSTTTANHLATSFAHAPEPRTPARSPRASARGSGTLIDIPPSSTSSTVAW